jgi:phenylacetate-CoA ligase
MPDPPGALALAMQFQLSRSQWLAPAELQARQFAQLAPLIDYAFATTTFYRQRLGAAGYKPDMPIDPDWFARIPALSRIELQQRPTALTSGRIPPEHGQCYAGDTSGSSGIPVRCYGSDVTALLWRALTLREYLWHRRDFSAKLLAIRAGADSHAYPDWGAGIREAFHTGPMIVLSTKLGIDEQHARLCREDPAYLVSHPSIVRDLALHSIRTGKRPKSLAEVRTVGEVLHDDLRAIVTDAWGAPVVDTYSAVEVGYMALQCPRVKHYHIQSEAVLVEVLDQHGVACKPGEVGRVVVTMLHNFAMPLIRYDIGDYAEVGEPCACGRGLPVLTRIMGRRRNMLVLPDGRRIWPTIAARDWRRVAPIVQCRFVQKSAARVQAQVVAERRLSQAERSAFADLVVGRWGRNGPIELVIDEVDAIARGAGEKFEDFVSEIA